MTVITALAPPVIVGASAATAVLLAMTRTPNT